MLFIMDIIPMFKILKTFTGKCATCGCMGDVELIKTYHCFRLFFIPIFKWKVQYYLKPSCGQEVTVSEEIALGILYGKISVDQIRIEHRLSNPNLCPHCGKTLENDFGYCPYCGRRRSAK